MILSLLLCALSVHAQAAIPSVVQALDYDASIARRPQLVLDLDVLDANIAALQRLVPAGGALRFVEKSLPSSDLLAHILRTSGHHHVLVFHPPYLRELQRTMPADTDFFFGKVVTATAAAEAVTSAPVAGGARRNLLERTTWLVDSGMGLRRLADALVPLAGGVPINVAVELDVGLARGGVSSRVDLSGVILAVDELGPTQVHWRGVLGYDGHVPFVPVPQSLERHRGRLVARAFDAMLGSYQGYIDQIRGEAPEFADDALAVRQGGGSHTITFYRDTTVVNDLAVGSALVKPADYDAEALSALAPALFVAAPVMKAWDYLRLPFLDMLTSRLPLLHLALSDRTALVWGGGWNSESYYPAGWKESELLTDGSAPLVPNQGPWFCPASQCAPVTPGQWMFFRPRQSDRIAQFSEILTVRGARVVGRMLPFTARY